MSDERELETRTAFRWRLVRVITIPTAALLTIALLLGTEIRATFRAAEQLQHSQRVLMQIEETQLRWLDLESGVRAYLLTRDDSYLDLYERARAELRPAHERLSAVARDNPAQVQHVRALTAQLDARAARLRELVHTRPPFAAEHAAEFASTRVSLRTAFDELLASEREHVRATDARYRTKTRGVLIAATALMATLLFGWAWFARTQLRGVARSYTRLVLELERRMEGLERARQERDALMSAERRVDTGSDGPAREPPRGPRPAW